MDLECVPLTNYKLYNVDEKSQVYWVHCGNHVDIFVRDRDFPV